MPVVASALLSDLRRQVSSLEADLKQQVGELPDLEGSLRDEWQNARDAGRVGDAFEIWLGEQATQAAVHWVLGCVFVRFLEDNHLIGEPLIAGPGERLREAESREAAYYGEHPLENERDWLLHAFREVAALPGSATLFDERHNPVFRWPISPDAAKTLVRFWRRQDPGTGALVHVFVDPEWETRFLGDLYQDLSDHAKKKYALLQTPVFVEEFILDRTLGEAMRALPLERVTVIDPTCGSGHFLLGAFSRLLAAWEAAEPASRREILAQRALDQIAGVDLNPFAAAIARFRLLIAALRACGVDRLRNAPAFRIHVAVGDALLHGATQIEMGLGDEGRRLRMTHAFSDEDLNAVNEVLSRRYATVVGNPPYITPKDKALNAAYRARYRTCHRQYALSVPFIERFWQLAAKDSGGGIPGWVGMINANSFMKREFGSKVIRDFFPRVDLTHVIDSSKAHIPNHGTPTVIILGRNRPPLTSTVRTVVGIRAERVTPPDPERGQVWTAIVQNVERPGVDNGVVSVTDMPRETFNAHPWHLGQNAARELQEAIEAAAGARLGSLASAMGFQQSTHADDAFIYPVGFLARRGIREGYRRFVRGEALRDWSTTEVEEIVFPYTDTLDAWKAIPMTHEWAWFHALRTSLWSRATFAGPTYREAGLPWFVYHQFPKDRTRDSRSLVYAFVATHNHVAFDRGGHLFHQSAPVVKLDPEVTDDVFHNIAGVLNTSVAAFWLRQVCHNKGGGGIGGGLATEAWEQFLEYTSAAFEKFPIPTESVAAISRLLDERARERQRHLPAAIVEEGRPTRQRLDAARREANELLAQMIALQEELDWISYQVFGLTTDALVVQPPPVEHSSLPALRLGERAFEISLARRLMSGDEESTWFARHDSVPKTELPDHWPAEYRALVERRIAAIETNPHLNLLEQPEHKRRWHVKPWSELEHDALGRWLLERLEAPDYWPSSLPQSTRELASRAAIDADFGRIAALWADDTSADLEAVIRRLVLDESVPFIAALRYSQTGRVKRELWERTWELQRQEDALDAQVASELRRFDEESDEAYGRRLAAAQKARREEMMNPIDRPPKYALKDFATATYWALRGPLDVPKERFILYPFANRAGDDAPLVGWAGWDYLQQAQALAALYVERTQTDGWQGAQVMPILAGVAELVPWLKQWHNQVDPEYGQRLGDFYATWLEEELRTQGLTRADLANWRPPESGRGRRRRA